MQRDEKIGRLPTMCGSGWCRTVGSARHTVAADTPEPEKRETHEALCHRTGDPRGRPTSASEELAAIAGKSNDVVESLGVPYRWITSYVAGDKIYCVHEADDEDAIREHARRGGFPANSVNVIANEFGPHTAAQAQ